tara:strand:- start:1587 stop:2618 length:1032 start_codon:yes stop_codon:yes gene_type:complete
VLKKEKLLNFCVSVLLKLNMDEDKALKTSEILIEADMMGHYTHGTRLLPMYISDIEKGNMRVSGEVEIIKDTGPCVTWDGKLLPGIWLTHEAISLASKRCKKHGVVTVLVGNSHHNGALAAYMLPFVDKGLLVLIKSSVPSSASVAPFGGTEPLLTPDPMAIGFPTNENPVIIDISASITTNNMIGDKIVNNEKFDFDCLLTAEGIPTNDPIEVREKGGTVLPIGGMEYGHKGFGLALGVEALSQGLSGFGRLDKPKNMNLSTIVQVIDAEFFSGLENFKNQMSYTINKAKLNKPVPGKKIYIPGERAISRRTNALKIGIKLSNSTIKSLKNLSEKFDVEFFY